MRRYFYIPVVGLSVGVRRAPFAFEVNRWNCGDSGTPCGPNTICPGCPFGKRMKSNALMLAYLMRHPSRRHLRIFFRELT